jgi:hypothetical protein
MVSKLIYCEKILLLAFITAFATWCPLAGADASCEFYPALPATDVLIGYIGNRRQSLICGTQVLQSGSNLHLA